MTAQPTHHGYAVNIKDYSSYENFSPLTGEEVQRIYDQRAEDFWELVQDVARAHGFKGAWSAGRLGGWVQPYPQPYPQDDDEDDDEIAAWMRDTFRPFEAEVIALRDACIEEFRGDALEAQSSAIREPDEAAHWAARDTITVAS